MPKFPIHQIVFDNGTNRIDMTQTDDMQGRIGVLVDFYKHGKLVRRAWSFPEEAQKAIEDFGFSGKIEVSDEVFQPVIYG